MNRRLLYWLCLSLLLLAACQPVRPENSSAGDAEISVPPSSSTVITGSAQISDTVAITSSTAITASSEPTGATSSTGSTVISETTQSTVTTGAQGSAEETRPSSTPATGASADVSTCPAVEDSALDLTVVANWDEDEQVHYLVHKSRTERVDGDTTLSISSTTPVTITVVSDDGEGYILEWQYGQTELTQSSVEVPDPLAALFQSPLEIIVTYATDEAGTYVELQNEERLQAQLMPVIDEMFDAILESGREAGEEFDAEMVETARGMVDAMISDPANFDSLFTQEVQLFHTLYDFYFEDTEPQVLPDLRPNMLGGSPIPSELTITPTHYDAELGCLRVMMQNVADPGEARNSILETLQEQARQLGVDGPTEDDLPAKMDMVDDMRFEIDLESGWPERVYAERAITLGNQSRLESTEIVRDEVMEEASE